MLDFQIALEDEQHSTAYDCAFLNLSSEIQRTVIDEAVEESFTKVTDLRARYVNLLQQEGVDAPNYRVSKLKHRLQKYFGNALVFFGNPQSVTDSELVASANIPQNVLLQILQHRCTKTTYHRLMKRKQNTMTIF